jgi:arylsulfatase A-like enzyme/Tfp pilus assembly protein PilF
VAACGGDRVRDAGGGDTEPHDLVLVTLDTVRADRLGCYGHAGAATPNLDALAKRGVRFENAMTAAPLTAPSHATLLTGLYPSRHGVHANGLDRLPSGTFHLAEHLSARGYDTAAFVGAFVLDRRFGFGRGFATYDDDLGAASAATGALEAARTADVVIDRALQWLGKASPERPFFLWVHLWDAHAPYSPPEPFRTRHAGHPYDGEIAFVDAQIGRLVAALESRSVPAVVAVTADHGEALEDHGERSHGLLLYEPTLRVPLIVAGGGLGAGATVDAPVSLVDLAPTLAGLIGRSVRTTEAMGGVDGRDLSSELRAREPIAPTELFAETRYPSLFGWSPLAAVRYRAAKYIHGPRPELFDLEADPRESRNLATERRELAQRLGTRLASLQAQGAAASPIELDDDTRERLAALGYLSSGAASTGAIRADGIDPKDRVAAFRAFEEARWAALAGRHRDAAARLEPLVRAEPGNVAFRLQLAESSRRAGDLAGAERHYRALLDLDPDRAETWYHFGVALNDQGRHADAVDAFARAIELEPERAAAHNLLGIAYLALGRLEDARAAFETAIEKNPDDARAWNNLGNASRDLEQAAEAERAYRKAAALDPGYSDPLNGLGTLLVRERRAREALTLFDRALALRPDQIEVLLNRAIAHDVLGDRDAAIAGYRSFLEAAAGHDELAEQRRSATSLLERLQQMR